MNKNKPEEYKYGIELECCIPYQTYDAFRQANDSSQGAVTLFAFGSDGSIRTESKGLAHEIRASRPLNYTELVSQVTRLGAECEKAGVYVNVSCGYHLHISTEKFFNQFYLKRFIRTWIAIEDVLVSTQPASRMNNGYCQRYLIQYLDNVASNFTYSKSKNKLVRDLASKQRRNALNLTALSKHGSIEIRLHAGTTNAEKIINWARLITTIAEYSFKKFNKNQMDTFFKQEISEEKIHAVFLELGLDQDVAEYYKARIEKHLFKSLQAHNKAALSNLDMLLKIRAEEKKLKLKQKIVQETIRLQEEMRQRRSANEDEIISLQLIIQDYRLKWENLKRVTMRNTIIS